MVERDYRVRIEKSVEFANGTVEIKENNKIVVKDPVGLGNYPTITPCEFVEFYVNDIRVTNTVVVSEEDIIEVIPYKSKNSFDFSVDISEDKMKAILSFHKDIATSYKLVIQEPVQHMRLKVELSEESKGENEDQINKELLKQIINRLDELGITFGIKHNKLKTLVKETKIENEVIAEGLQGKEGQDANIKYLFYEDINNKHFSIKQNGRIDYRERKNLLSVDPGTVLAVKYPAINGKPGINIFGEKIKGRDVRDIKLEVGKGVKKYDNDTKAVAINAGRPILRKNGTIEVAPLYIHYGDVDMKFGNLNFDGDVLVKGNVNEGMKVTNKGYADINGNVNGGTIRALENVFCKNVIKGKIEAGGSSAIYSSLYMNLTRLLEDLTEIRLNTKNINTAHSKTDINQLLREHILLKQNSFRKMIKEILSITESKDVSESLKSTVDNLKHDFLMMGKLTFDYNLYSQFVEELNIAVKEVKEGVENKGNVEAYYTQNSEIETSGSVYIKGNGCFNTIIRSGGDVYINGEPGVFKGGEITAGGKVLIREAGSSMGAYTSIKVPFEGQIKLLKVHPNVHIMVGRQSYKFSDDDLNVWCRVKGGRLEIR